MCVCVFGEGVVGVGVLGWEERWKFASTALVMVWMAKNLTSYSDYLIVSMNHTQHLTEPLEVLPVLKISSTITVEL